MRKTIATLCLFLGSISTLPAQQTVSTGSIQGVVTDPGGAAVPSAVVTITGKATGQVTKTITASSGAYTSGALVPGDYSVRVEAKGFQTASMNLAVEVGLAASGNVQMQLGPTSFVIEVVASSVSMETQQAIVQGVVTSAQIDNLPINGRNFLDLAQLEPGVQIQDGTNFDPTKVGYSSIAFGGRFGRTARIYVDGVDISDETVGTTTGDIPANGIQEFQLSQSNLDLSNDLTSSGAVNVITRSGSNEYHGEAFYSFRDSRFGAALPHPAGLPAPYQLNQFGGRLGGPIVRNRFFFFADYERAKQDSFFPVAYPTPFQKFSSGYSSPFRKNLPMLRLDWQATPNLRLFYRFNYYSTLADGTFFPSSLQPYKSKNYSRTHVAGADFNSGTFTHSFRFEQLRFQNDIGDAVIGSHLPLAGLGVNLSVQDGPQTGPNLLAPQTTAQFDRQFKYDGGKPLGKHFLRYGVNYNYIVVGGFASFFAIEPQVQTNFSPDDAAAAAAGPFPGGASNPLNYPVELVIVGNGQGYSTEKPALGYPAGRLGPDHRFGLYLGDTWRVRRNLTLTLGARYARDTGRTDSDLPAIAEMNALLPGTGAPVHQPSLNLAPQIGVAWDPAGKGKTILRAGAGLFYENIIFNNVLFDRPVRLKSGAFLQTALACNFGQALPVSLVSGTITMPAELCNEPVGLASAGIAAFQRQFQAASPFNLQAPNPNYAGTLLRNGVNLPNGVFAPGYKTPRSFQMNAGLQREIFRGTVLTIDYLRNVATHFLLGIDSNHVGDAKYFNKSAAQSAIRATLDQFGASSINGAIAAGASMADFASNGLTSPSLDFGGVCPFDDGCAFSGINPKAPGMSQMQPVGRSVYNGMDVKVRQTLSTGWKSMKRVNAQVAYSLSRFVNPGMANPSVPGNNDQDFVYSAEDYNHPLQLMGPSLLDRTHQLSFGGYFDFAHGFRASTIAHFYSGLPITPVVPNTGQGAGEIFRTDFTGDGTVQDVLPGASMGSFNRDYGPAGLAGAIANYNKTVANQATPASRQLIDAGLFTLAQLQALGGVAPIVQTPPPGQVGVGGLRTFDLSLSWTHKFGERLVIEPKASAFNIFNFVNFDLPPNTISGLLNGSAGSINGTTSADRISNRVGLGTGVFSLGAPRSIELGLRISF